MFHGGKDWATQSFRNSASCSFLSFIYFLFFCFYLFIYLFWSWNRWTKSKLKRRCSSVFVMEALSLWRKPGSENLHNTHFQQNSREGLPLSENDCVEMCKTTNGPKPPMQITKIKCYKTEMEFQFDSLSASLHAYICVCVCVCVCMHVCLCGCVHVCFYCTWDGDRIDSLFTKTTNKTKKANSVPDNAQLQVCYIQISILTYRCEACASCWCSRISINWDDWQPVRKQS